MEKVNHETRVLGSEIGSCLASRISHCSVLGVLDFFFLESIEFFNGITECTLLKYCLLIFPNFGSRIKAQARRSTKRCWTDEEVCRLILNPYFFFKKKNSNYSFLTVKFDWIKARGAH